jgi:site-specific DNA-methyltransferase (adenine-specific)
MSDTIHTGDAFDVLPDLPDESMHACVTDPPYGLAFMGRDWDDFEPKEYQEWCEKWAREVKRVLKPGGHMLAFSGNRTHHRLFTGVEDAGFEIRDTLTWHYGSGFPKASDISKTIDKRADAEREVIRTERQGSRRDATTHQYNTENRESNENGIFQEKDGHEYDKTAPATDAAKQWDGFKTGLKPATEYVVVARKPFDGATVDAVLEHGTGALNIDPCRVATDGEKINRNIYDGEEYDGSNYGQVSQKVTKKYTDTGRYPANVVFDETADTDDVPTRYFYTSKASKAERTLDGAIDNAHPTVKPADLMEWLVKLVTAEGQTVLDPFTGSGTTCRAAKDLGRRFVGIEKQAKWADVARVRAGLTPDDPSVVREDGITGLDAFADD